MKLLSASYMHSVLDIIQQLHDRVLCLELKIKGTSQEGQRSDIPKEFLSTRPTTFMGGTYSDALREQMVRLISRNEKVLEICAGDAQYAKELRDQGIDITATDIEPFDSFVSKEDATDSVKNHPHSVLLLVHPMPGSDLNTPRDYVSKALQNDQQAQTVILVLNIQTDDAEFYTSEGFFENLLDWKLFYVVEECCDEDAAEVLYVLKRIPKELDQETIRTTQYPVYDVTESTRTVNEQRYTVYDIYRG